jgi:hypothetical protein
VRAIHGIHSSVVWRWWCWESGIRLTVWNPVVHIVEVLLVLLVLSWGEQGASRNDWNGNCVPNVWPSGGLLVVSVHGRKGWCRRRWRVDKVPQTLRESSLVAKNWQLKGTKKGFELNDSVGRDCFQGNDGFSLLAELDHGGHSCNDERRRDVKAWFAVLCGRLKVMKWEMPRQWVTPLTLRNG